MLKLRNLALILPVLLAACQTAPRVLVQAVCPAIPALEQDAPGPAFGDRMENFLRGNLPEQTDYGLTSGSASKPIKLPVTP